MSADKARVRDLRDDRRLDATDIGDHELARFVREQQGVHLGSDDGDWCRHERDSGKVVHADLVNGPEISGALCPGSVQIVTCHPPPLSS